MALIRYVLAAAIGAAIVVGAATGILSSRNPPSPQDVKIPSVGDAFVMQTSDFAVCAAVSRCQAPPVLGSQHG
jgi:hypothetical protein